MKLVETHIIWDRDHGSANEGWYARLFREDGQQIDCPFEAPQTATDAELRRKARQEARAWGLDVPAGEKYIYRVQR